MMKRFIFFSIYMIIATLLIASCTRQSSVPSEQNSNNKSYDLSAITDDYSGMPGDSSAGQTNEQISGSNSQPSVSNTQPSAITSTSSKPYTNIVENATLNVGEYVQVGKYYGEPIIWRCVEKDINGPLMLSDRILTIKAFDAGGTNLYLDKSLQTDDTRKSRETNGSNLWETSSLRAWLNSDAASGKVDWLGGSPPIKYNLKDGINDYSKEEGFLSLGNFTADEKKWIKSVSQKALIGVSDQEKLKTGGTEALINKGGLLKNGNPIMQSFPEVLTNFDKAYYHPVADRIFILDINQISKIATNDKIFDENYYIGKPTQKLIDNSEHKDLAFLSVQKYWYTWTRTPVGDENITSVYALSFESPFHKKGVYYINANHYYLGVRPAFYMYMESSMFIDGDGSLLDPYIFKVK